MRGLVWAQYDEAASVRRGARAEETALRGAAAARGFEKGPAGAVALNLKE